MAANPYRQLLTAVITRWPELRFRTPLRSVANFGALAADQRRRLGMSQGQLAKAAGVGRRFVSELENGKDTIQMNQALRVLGALGLKLTIEEVDLSARAPQQAN